MNVVSTLRAARPMFDSWHTQYFSCPVQRVPEAHSVRISDEGAKLTIYSQLGPFLIRPKAIYTPDFKQTHAVQLCAKLSA
jgi:hypothetical protein